MSLINLFWNLNVTDSTKYLMIFGLMVCIMCMCYFSGHKKNIKKKNKIHFST